ncbi:hypothetical protein H311_01477 [Anncaliia algerae PRA109]|nr:hypothetical protein H311_01477 [Anncaliia algerae PRA109]
MAKNKKIFSFFLNFILICTIPLIGYYWHIFINQHSLIFKIPTDDKLSNYFKKEDGEVFDLENYKLYKFNGKTNRNIIFFHGSIISPKVHYKNCKRMSEYGNIWTYLLPKYDNKERLNEFTLLRSALLVSSFISSKTNKIALFGQSLGCSLALFVSYKLNLPIILENPFYNGKSFLKVKTSIFFRWLMSFKLRNDFYLSKIQNKVYILAAENEDVIDKDDTLNLSKIKCDMFVKIKGTTHTTMGKQDEYFKQIGLFLNDIFE